MLYVYLKNKINKMENASVPNGLKYEIIPLRSHNTFLLNQQKRKNVRFFIVSKSKATPCVCTK